MSIRRAEFCTSVPAVAEVSLRGVVVPLAASSAAAPTGDITVKGHALGLVAQPSGAPTAIATASAGVAIKFSNSQEYEVDGHWPVGFGRIGMSLGEATPGGFDEYARSDDNLREQINSAAYRLFQSRGILDVSLAEIERDAGVSSAERKQVFLTKRDVAQAFADRRDRMLTLDSFEAGARERGTTAEERLLAIFDVVDDWFHRDDYEARSFVHTLLEMDAADPLGQDAGEYLLNIRAIISVLGSEADLNEPAEFAVAFHFLVQDATVFAVDRDFEAARRLKALAQALIIDYRQQAPYVLA